MSIIDLNGREISSVKKAANSGQMTQAQAGAVVVSELDIAIKRFNDMAVERHKELGTKPPVYEIVFDKFAYAEEVQKKTSLFGYGELAIYLTLNDVRTKIYSKAKNARSEADLENTNGYYPEIVFDCIGFLLASGLMYNLALIESKNESEESRTVQPGNGNKDKPRTRNSRKPGKTGDGLAG